MCTDHIPASLPHRLPEFVWLPHTCAMITCRGFSPTSFIRDLWMNSRIECNCVLFTRRRTKAQDLEAFHNTCHSLLWQLCQIPHPYQFCGERQYFLGQLLLLLESARTVLLSKRFICTLSLLCWTLCWYQITSLNSEIWSVSFATLKSAEATQVFIIYLVLKSHIYLDQLVWLRWGEWKRTLKWNL